MILYREQGWSMRTWSTRLLKMHMRKTNRKSNLSRRYRQLLQSNFKVRQSSNKHWRGLDMLQVSLRLLPPPKEVKGLNSLENIRRELNNSRVAAKPVKPPAHVPAPPRPAGFNSKRAPPVIGRSLNTLRHKKVTSDSSDDEGDIDTSDLFVTKKKVSKITELDMNGKVINLIDRIPKTERRLKSWTRKG